MCDESMLPLATTPVELHVLVVRTPKKPPDSFTRMVTNTDGVLKTEAQIATDYEIGTEVARFYAEQGPAFAELNNTRNLMVHNGRTLPSA